MRLYERYHENRRSEKRVISENDFTHNPLLRILRGRLNNYTKMLDIGCGTGTVCFYFAARGIDTVGIDISKNAIKLAKMNAKSLSLSSKTNFFVSDFPNDKLSGKFDLIICSEVLEHIENDTKAISKVYSLLEKGGEVFFSVPLKTSFLYRLGFLENFDEKVGHLRRYNDLELLNLIRRSKLMIIKSRKNQGLLRDFLFTFTTRSLLVRMANRFKVVSNILTFLDEKLFFIGVSNMVILAKKR